MAKKSFIRNFFREFVSEENRPFRVRLGYTLASSLAGLVAGVIISSIIWYQALNYAVEAIKNICLNQ
ncbi:MAG: hypothetical protein NT026_01280 [Candidatus Staskawiczbacteria bacterium]|nr:hypothetical protein [Candidatus Staskawiczbacteria bacterium]